MTTRTQSARDLLLSPHWLWLLPLAAAFGPTAAWLWDRWTQNVYSNGHGLFVPLILVYLLRENLKSDPIAEPASSPWGFAFLGVSASLLALDAAIDTDVLSAIALVLCLPGLSLLLLGAPRTRSLTFPLLLGAFMIPVPSGAISLVHLALRHISAWGSHQLVGLYGIPVLREGTTMLVPNAAIEVADACSGVSTLYAAVLLALILAYMARSLRQAVVLLAASVVLAIICNTIRVFALILIVHYWGVSPLETPLHELTGMVSFVIVLAALFFLARPREMRGAAA